MDNNEATLYAKDDVQSIDEETIRQCNECTDILGVPTRMLQISVLSHFRVLVQFHFTLYLNWLQVPSLIKDAQHFRSSRHKIWNIFVNNGQQWNTALH